MEACGAGAFGDDKVCHGADRGEIAGQGCAHRKTVAMVVGNIYSADGFGPNSEVAIAPTWLGDRRGRGIGSVRSSRANLLEHSVIVCRFLRNPLNNVPVFDHFAVLKLVDIDNRKSERARLAHGMIVDDHIIANQYEELGPVFS